MTKTVVVEVMPISLSVGEIVAIFRKTDSYFIVRLLVLIRQLGYLVTLYFILHEDMDTSTAVTTIISVHLCPIMPVILRVSLALLYAINSIT